MAEEIWSDTWEFEYEESQKDESTIETQYETQAFNRYATLNFSAKASTTQQTVFIAYTTLEFGAKASITAQGNTPPTNSDPSPANDSTGIGLNSALNITVSDADANTMNQSFWTNQSGTWRPLAYNNNTANASLENSTTDFNIYNTKYYWSSNLTDGQGNWVNNTYHFTTQTIPAIVVVNESTHIEEQNATLHGYLQHNGSDRTYCYFELDDADDFTDPLINHSVGYIDDKGAFSYNASGLDNGTIYYVRTKTNDSYGWNTSATTDYLLTKPQPATSINIANISGGFNISWTHGDGNNGSYLAYRIANYPVNPPGDALNTQIYLGPKNYYEHTGLTDGVTYHYRVWERANCTTPEAMVQYSDGNESSFKTYSDVLPVFSHENPEDTATGVSTDLAQWNVTIAHITGSFDWSIVTSPDVGSNSANGDSNGSKHVTVSGNLSAGTLYTVYVNATGGTGWNNQTYTFSTQTLNFTVYDTLSFSGMCEVQGDNPILTNEYPSDGSTDSAITTMLNITINDPQAQTMNITWLTNESGNWVAFAYNSTVASGSTCRQEADWATDGETKYWWNVSVNDTSNHWTNETYHFTTESDRPELTPTPANESTGQDMYVMLNLTVTDPQGDTMNVSWSTNASGSWVYHNATVTSGSYAKQRAIFANASNTKYWWTVRVNDTDNHWTNETFWFSTATYTWGDWSEWWTFNYTCCNPYDFDASFYNSTVINLTWANCVSAGCDKNVLIRNESGWEDATYPISPTNGTEIYNGTLEAFNDTSLSPCTNYYYSLWGWNETTSNYSLNYTFAFNRTNCPPQINLIYPSNSTGSISKRPTCRIYANDSNGGTLDVYWLENTTGPYVIRNINYTVSANSSVSYKFTQFNDYSTTYYWRVYINDGIENITNWFNFTTASNTPPTQDHEEPANDSEGKSLTPELNITVNDDNHDLLNVSWWSNSSGAWIWFAENLSIDPSSGAVNIKQTNSNFSVLDTKYWWSVNLSDGTTWVNDTYNFKTADISIANEYPVNESTGVERPATNFSVNITGTNLDIYFYYVNYSQTSNTTYLIESWTGESTGRFEYITPTIPDRTDFMWGNTKYYWTVNVTDGSTWVNKSYNFMSIATAGGKNARLDVQLPLSLLNIGDAQAAWNAVPAAYNRLYDVQLPHGLINVGDAQAIWNDV